MAWLAIIAISINPAPDGRTDDMCDRIELNHFYEEDGSHVFDQFVFWDWNYDESRWEVVDWRLIEGCRVLEDGELLDWQRTHPRGPPYVPRLRGDVLPRRIRHRRGSIYAVEWWDKKDRRFRQVQAKLFNQTWTAYDPELANREALPQEKRRRLTR